jgi:flagellar hook-associated protein 1 FlgK
MINSFQSLSSITSGLILQQLEQEITANNLAQTSVDSQGYLENSLEQVNSVNNPSLAFTGINGLLSVGTGSSAESITRLRSSFLDNQIQQESSVVGYNSVFYQTSTTGVINEISSIINGTTSLSTTLNAFTTAWTNLAANPTASTTLQADVVTAGENFANEANSEYNQLQTLQSTVTGQMGQTVIQINQILQQLSGINKQILGSAGSNDNSLLDARDYALDQLSQLTNFQATFNSSGTVNVWLNDLSLVDASGAAVLNVNATNYNNTLQPDVAIQSPQGSVTVRDASSLITGGTLGGELQTRGVVIPDYMNQINEMVSSVLTMTNNLYNAGYIANTATTGTNFFDGTSASNIAVTQAIINASTSTPFLATEVNPNSAAGKVAGFIGNLQNLMAGNFLGSATAVPVTPPLVTIDPTKSLLSQGLSATAGISSFTLNGVYTISYTDANSIDDILNKINTTVPGVSAVFNDTTLEFEIYSSTPLTFVGTAGDKFKWAHLASVITSTMPINNPLAESDPQVDFFDIPLSANYSFNAPPVEGPNTLAFLISPSSNGSFTVNGTTVKWNNDQILDIDIFPNLPGSAAALQVGQKLELINQNQPVGTVNATPIQIADVSGNFTSFMWLKNSNTKIGDLSSDIMTQLTNQTSTYQTAYNSSSASLLQLNTAQANIAGVSTTITVNGVKTTMGVPQANIEQQAEQSMITYNAMLEVMQIIDQMLASLVGVSSTTSSSGIFTQESTS